MRPPLILASVLVACSSPPSSSSQPEPSPLGAALQPSESAETDNDRYAARVEAVRAFIKKRAPKSQLRIIVEPPFVVVGDESELKVRSRATGTIRWGVERLKHAFFEKDPSRDLTVWLFDGEESYRRHALALWGERPDTPYGYYSSSQNALVMNIATGGGTLLHEIVHPFIEANFPQSPAWFNEGLGSLFEQSSERNHQIVGLLNWRLAGLKEVIRDGTLIDFQTLMGLSEDEFYGDDSGSHYAQARYLLYYLQEQKSLRTFYKDYVANVATDPTGVATLKKVLGVDDLAAFQDEWEAWILTLEFRR